MENRTRRPGQEYVGAILSTIETTLGSGDQRAHASAVVAAVPDDAQQTEESEGPKYVPLTEVGASARASARALERFLVTPDGQGPRPPRQPPSADGLKGPELVGGLPLMSAKRSVPGEPELKIPEEIQALIKQLAKEGAKEALAEQEAPNEDSSSDDDERGVVHEMPEDCYGAAILSIVRFMDEYVKTEGEEYRLQLYMFSFVTFLHVLNLVVQFSLLQFIDLHVVHPAIHNVQLRYRDYHEKAFDSDGLFLRDMWDGYGFKDELCQIGMTSSFSYLILLLIWVTSMLREVRSSAGLFLDISKMSLHQSAGNMISVSSSGNTFRIVGLTSATRFCVIAVVVFPKGFISICLLTLGCQWLSATLSFEALVMNTVAMEFVVHVDEVLYEAFLPTSFRNIVGCSKFFMPFPLGAHAVVQDQDAKRRAKAWVEYGRETAFFTSTCIFVYLYANFIQDVLPNKIDTWPCKGFLEDMEPVCHSWMRTLSPHDLFQHLAEGLGNCFPYGISDV